MNLKKESLQYANIIPTNIIKDNLAASERTNFINVQFS